ncbi:SurA N-terminal domain-containing protein [Niallia sp. Krafla_26]|uniref:SurA N-terminal domain-containing protein n=1 Tax=Niallia sp. Krafla_26 TaxID=3064703 RepID=UPI003D1764E4
MFKRASMGFILISVLVFILGACSNESSKESKTETVATVNGEEILKKDYDKQLENSKAYFQQQGMNVDDLDNQAQEEFEQSVLDQLINTKLLLQTAQKEGVTIEQSEINAEVDKMKSQFEDTKKYQEALKENQLTEKNLKEEIKDQLTLTKFFDKRIGDITVSDDEVKSMYEQYKKQAESQGQERLEDDFESVKPQLEQQAIAQKKNEKITELIEGLRKDSEKNIKIL